MKQWQERSNLDHQHGWKRRGIFENKLSTGRLREVFLGISRDNKYSLHFLLTNYQQDLPVFLTHLNTKQIRVCNDLTYGFNFQVGENNKSKIDDLLDAINEIEPIEPAFLLQLREEFGLLRKKPEELIRNEIEQLYRRKDFEAALKKAMEAEELTYSNKVAFLAQLCSKEQDLISYAQAVLKLNDPLPAFELASAFLAGLGSEAFSGRRDQLEMALHLACRAAELGMKTAGPLVDRIFHELCNPGQGIQESTLKNIPPNNVDFLIDLSHHLFNQYQTIQKLEKATKKPRGKNQFLKEGNKAVRNHQHTPPFLPKQTQKQVQDKKHSAKEILATVNPALFFG